MRARVYRDADWLRSNGRTLKRRPAIDYARPHSVFVRLFANVCETDKKLGERIKGIGEGGRPEKR